MKRNIQDVLDGDVPWDVPQWIVEMHTEFDECDLTPLEAVRKASREVMDGHCWHVTHVRSGLRWSVCLEREEVFEVSDAA
jgi:hypothetical protein